MSDQKYNGWLTSNNIIKRAIAVWWHMLVARLFLFLVPVIIIGVIYAIVIIFTTLSP